ncbi:MAG: hypothetical protein UV73_C0005G0092 [Candidatus Gottesmanbacteria bacterium GW2011_GWA2_43_14]|uniref:Glycosyltransferase RgtA/B/C/D-like domain-containing protein n=1 Tax=Candidatus Gottesmanbacteria bacterium GW2011_GWA2_43_14 TaxID=1618443 RepID=A0A0G1DIZ1_9BACT|nr:MAG: hypothetical protein UV73_C0005G0092 [Candidatus Gottesmanbacteria bacterium GW2011_GWA2_43_14]
MVKYKTVVFAILIVFFLSFSYYPTLFELSQKGKLAAKNRVFILEHNYYWPDFNLYLSKIRQGYEGRWTAVEKYTSEPHRGSLIQIFYLYLGRLGNLLSISPNNAYQLGRFILSPLLLVIVAFFSRKLFKNYHWSLLAFLTTVVSGSFPKFVATGQGLKIERYMEWWSNTDSLQRLTFIPHILFGQVISFYLLYQIFNLKKPLSLKKIVFLAFLGILAGLVFPPSLMTLNGVILLLIGLDIHKRKTLRTDRLIFVILSSLSLLYLFVITKIAPWSALIEFHRTHPMMIPFDQYVLGTGPIIFLGFFGSLAAVIRREKKYYPLILWVVSTFLFASLFSIIREQSPLRFTQTGLFIPLGLLSAYFLRRMWLFFTTSTGRAILVAAITLYLLANLYIMYNSLKWQTSFISQRIGADYPEVPNPPQTMYPLTAWMEAINWLKNNTGKNEVVLAGFTAGNFIPAYAGNFVYFGQSNTVDYNLKQLEVEKFFKGEMSAGQAQIFLRNGRIKYVFVGPEEKDMLGDRKLNFIYPFVQQIYDNSQVYLYII